MNTIGLEGTPKEEWEWPVQCWCSELMRSGAVITEDDQLGVASFQLFGLHGEVARR